MNIHNPKEYCESVLKIRDKKGFIVPLTFNEAQSNLYDAIKREAAAGKPIRIIVLKGRQEGISTVTEGLMFQDTATRAGVHTLIVAHDADSTGTLFEMNRLFYDELPEKLKPMKEASNAREIKFGNPSRDRRHKTKRPGLRSYIRVATAGARGVARSKSLTNVHLSELGFWPGDVEKLMLGIMQSVPDEADTMVIIESTANGYNYFQTLWNGAETGENGWVPVFLPWYMEKGYRRPVDGSEQWTEDERQLQTAYGLDVEQLKWRRWCIKTNCGGNERLFRQEYPNTPAEAFLLSGDSFFDNDALGRYMRSVPKPIDTGWFAYDAPAEEGQLPTGRHWESRAGASDEGIRIWKRPEAGAPYVIGGDTAGEGSDRFTAIVIDNRTGEQVAELMHRDSEIHYARQIYCLGEYYNHAMLSVEVNYSTYPLRKLEEWGYPNLYQRERFDRFAGTMVKSNGWETSAKTRPQMLAELHTISEEAVEWLKSRWLIGEMITFIYDGEKRKPQAAAGQHDDLVMAAAICYASRHQMRMTVEEGGDSRKHWTEDMWEDWRAADSETQRMLERMWKNP